MSKVFHASGSQVPMQLERVVCKNETKELQDRLESQPELLAGDQIRPEDPRRWLKIKREMPVNSPTTGTKDFSLDFLFVDQDGIPTFVEAKRCGDPRARREVVGQMLEYATNGLAYWRKEELVQAFIGNYGGNSEQALAVLKAFRSGGEESLESFFGEVLEKLRNGVMRLIFFLEDSSYELRSIAEFLNEQFTNIEVFVVEARQYRMDLGEDVGSTIIVPHVVGFSEALRMSKQLNREGKERVSYEKGEEPFWKNLSVTLQTDQVESVRFFVDRLQSTNSCKVIWIVSCIVMLPTLLSKRGLFGIRKNGDLELYFGYWQSAYADITDVQIAARDHFISGLQEIGFSFDAQQRVNFPRLRPAQWIVKADKLLALIEQTSLHGSVK